MPLDSAEIARLTAEVAGPVLLPDDAGYPAECATFNLLTTVRPAVAVGALTPAMCRWRCASPPSGVCRWLRDADLSAHTMDIGPNARGAIRYLTATRQ